MKLAEWMRAKLPDIHDPHLYTLEELIRAKVKERKLNLRKLMGEEGDDEEGSNSDDGDDSDSAGEGGAAALPVPQAQVAAAAHDGGFKSHVPHKCLRCVKL